MTLRNESQGSLWSQLPLWLMAGMLFALLLLVGGWMAFGPERERARAEQERAEQAAQEKAQSAKEYRRWEIKSLSEQSERYAESSERDLDRTLHDLHQMAAESPDHPSVPKVRTLIAKGKEIKKRRDLSTEARYGQLHDWMREVLDTIEHWDAEGRAQRKEKRNP